VLASEMAELQAQVGEARWAGGRFAEAVDLFVEWSLAPELADFLTLAAYPRLVTTFG